MAGPRTSRLFEQLAEAVPGAAEDGLHAADGEPEAHLGDLGRRMAFLEVQAEDVAVARRVLAL